MSSPAPIDVLFAETVFGIPSDAYSAAALREALQSACHAHGHIDGLALAAWPGRPDWTPLFMCCVEGWGTSLRLTLEAPVPEDRALAARGLERTLTDGPYVGCTALHLAAANCHEDCVRLLLAAGAPRDALTGNVVPMTPLMICCTDAVEPWAAQGTCDLLVAHGADARQHNADFVGGAHLAAANLRADVVSALLRHKADLNAMDQQGLRPLHWCLQLNSPAPDDEARGRLRARLQLLIASRADPNLRDARGDTPLHYAVRHREAAAIPVLLDGKADAQLRNAAGDTALDVASRDAGLRRAALLLTNYVPVRPEKTHFVAKRSVGAKAALYRPKIGPAGELQTLGTAPVPGPSSPAPGPASGGSSPVPGPVSAVPAPAAAAAVPSPAVAGPSPGLGRAGAHFPAPGVASVSAWGPDAAPGPPAATAAPGLGGGPHPQAEPKWKAAKTSGDAPAAPGPKAPGAVAGLPVQVDASPLLSGSLFFPEAYEALCHHNHLRPNPAVLAVAALQAHMHDLTAVSLAEIAAVAYLGLKGTVAVAHMFRHCPNLEALDVSGLNLTNKETAALLAVLEGHPALSRLDLSGNRLSIAASKALLRLVSTNEALISVAVTDTGMPTAYNTSLLQRLSARLEGGS